MSDFIKRILNKIDDVKSVEVLTEDQMWMSHKYIIWKADSFKGLPFFYPVYRWENFYSYSVLALIIKKGTLKPNYDLMHSSYSNELVLSANNTIDEEITRIGGAITSSKIIVNEEQYSDIVTKALLEDVQEIEELNYDYTNIIMCGGKDSLNLLLLPWLNNTIAVSAEPNYRLVKQFINDNELNIKLIKLHDEYDKEYFDDEVLECCCRADLSNWRWGIHLRKLCESMDKVIIWKGQVGDLYLSTTWKNYIYPKPNIFIKLLAKAYKVISPYSPKAVNIVIGSYFQNKAYSTTWTKAAQLQGGHMGFLRSLTNSLVLSA